MSSNAAVSSMATAKAVLSTAASVATTAMLVRSVASDLIPYEFRDFLFSGVRAFLSRFSSNITLIVDEFDGLNNNQIFDAAQTYLAGRIPPSAQILKVSQPDKDHRITVAMGRNEEIVDSFAGAKLRWILLCRRVDSRSFHNPRDLTSTLSSEIRYFELTFHKKHKDTVLNSYLPHIVKEAKSIRNEIRTLKIFTVNHDHMYGNLSDAWNPVNLDHPATFATLAMEAEQKEAVVADLERFVRRREYYRRVGKAWKRGYLLYGPPGTGKSSLIAAMANYLNFNVYDLELTELSRNSDLRRLLVATANRSILVVEDIDCTIDLHDRLEKARAAQTRGYPNSNDKQITLSGLLNFIDGLWSSCGDERIIIFTTNHKHKLDPALLRPGRMDVHIHMSYCTPCGFRLLASNYLGLKDHHLFGQIEESIRTTKVTPAEVAEQLLKSDDPEAVLRDLIKFLDAKKEEEESEAKKSDKPKSSEDKNEGPNVTVADEDESHETICYLD